MTLPEQQTSTARQYRRPGVGTTLSLRFRSKQSMQPEPVIRVLLIDDHAVARNGVRLTLGTGLHDRHPSLTVLMLRIYGIEVPALRAIKHAAAGYRIKRGGEVRKAERSSSTKRQPDFTRDEAINTSSQIPCRISNGMRASSKHMARLLSSGRSPHRTRCSTTATFVTRSRRYVSCR